MPIAVTLGIECVSAAAGAAELRLPYRNHVSYAAGHGFPASVVGALIDFCGGAAVASLLPHNAKAVTVEFSTKMVAPANRPRLIARATVPRPAQGVVVSFVQVFGGDDEDLCALGLVTMRPLAA